jgi:hypothetical protein
MNKRSTTALTALLRVLRELATCPPWRLVAFCGDRTLLILWANSRLAAAARIFVRCNTWAFARALAFCAAVNTTATNLDCVIMGFAETSLPEVAANALYSASIADTAVTPATVARSIARCIADLLLFVLESVSPSTDAINTPFSTC